MVGEKPRLGIGNKETRSNSTFAEKRVQRPTASS